MLRVLPTCLQKYSLQNTCNTYREVHRTHTRMKTILRKKLASYPRKTHLTVSGLHGINIGLPFFAFMFILNSTAHPPTGKVCTDHVVGG